MSMDSKICQISLIMHYIYVSFEIITKNKFTFTISTWNLWLFIFVMSVF